MIYIKTFALPQSHGNRLQMIKKWSVQSTLKSGT